MRSSYRPTFVALGALAVFAVLFLVGGATGWWSPAANEQAIGEVSRWCERVADGLMREPANTLGNLGFVVAGLSMLLVLAGDTRRGVPRVNSFTGNQPVALLYAAAVVFLGPGSMVMHGSHTFFGAWIDNLSMVAYISIPWLFNLLLLGRWRERTFFYGYAAVLAGFALGYWYLGPDLGVGIDLFGVSIALWIISEVLFRFWSRVMVPVSGLVGFAVAFAFGITPGEMLANPGGHWWVVLFWVPAMFALHPAATRRRYFPWFWAGLASFLLSYAIWTTGTADHPWCAPDSIVQAHAIWHLGTAFATWCFFKFLRSERAIGPATTNGA